MKHARRITRRDFVRGAAAAVAAPAIVPASVFGQDGRPAPSDRITMACIGLGNQGNANFGNFLNRPEVQMVAVCDVRKEKREEFRARVEKHYGDNFKGCDAYNEFELIMARPDIDAVMIGTPDHWHALITIAACRSGKDVYCEKPLSLTIREGQAMRDAVRRYGRVFQTGSQQRSSDEFHRACEFVRNGRIGKLLTVHVNIGNTSSDKIFPEEPVPPGFDWNRWLGPAPWRPYNAEACSGNFGGGFRLVRDYSGGMMTDWGAHHFDITQWGVGADDSGPVQVDPPSPDGMPLVYTYANGVKAYHAKVDGKGEKVNGVLFTGTDGKIEVNRGHFRSWPNDLSKEPLGQGEVKLYKSRDHHKNFLDCVRERLRPICDVEIGYRSVTVCHLGNLAYWLKRTIRWDPVKEEIVGDPAAARWMERPMRAPWRL
jgi:predicted dehydrogenase